MWRATTINTTELDLSGDFEQPKPQTTAELLAIFEEGATNYRAALEGASDDDLLATSAMLRIVMLRDSDVSLGASPGTIVGVRAASGNSGTRRKKLKCLTEHLVGFNWRRKIRRSPKHSIPLRERKNASRRGTNLPD